MGLRARHPLEIPKGEDELITTADVAGHEAAISESDLVCIATGWSALREIEPERFAGRGPLLHPDAARLLIEGHPRLRAIATDAISIGSPLHRAESHESHRILSGMGRSDGRFVLIYEDVRLDPAVAHAWRVYAWPLMADGADGTPCTMVAELG